jgi:hypothetical protein
MQADKIIEDIFNFFPGLFNIEHVQKLNFISVFHFQLFLAIFSNYMFHSFQQMESTASDFTERGSTMYRKPS